MPERTELAVDAVADWRDDVLEVDDRDDRDDDDDDDEEPVLKTFELLGSKTGGPGITLGEMFGFTNNIYKLVISERMEIVVDVCCQ